MYVVAAALDLQSRLWYQADRSKWKVQKHFNSLLEDRVRDKIRVNLDQCGWGDWGREGHRCTGGMRRELVGRLRTFMSGREGQVAVTRTVTNKLFNLINLVGKCLVLSSISAVILGQSNLSWLLGADSLLWVQAGICLRPRDAVCRISEQLWNISMLKASLWSGATEIKLDLNDTETSVHFSCGAVFPGLGLWATCKGNRNSAVCDICKTHVDAFFSESLQQEKDYFLLCCLVCAQLQPASYYHHIFSM